MTTNEFKEEFPGIIPEDPTLTNRDDPLRHNIGGSMNRPVRNQDPLSPRNIEHNVRDNINPDYYAKMAISPYEYVTKNNLNWEQANIVKYISRYKEKNGKEDLLKVIKYAEMLIEREYGND